MALSSPHPSSSPPPGFTFSSTPPGPISSSSPLWSDGSTAIVSPNAELELSKSGPCLANEEFTRRLSELLSEVERRRNASSAGDFINTFQTTFDSRALSSTEETDAETEFSCDISPIVFNANAGFSSRIIHRASSYLCPSDHDSDSSPPRKRPKILTRTSTHTRLRTSLARTPASLRRAASLTSIPDDEVRIYPSFSPLTAPVSPNARSAILVPPNARGPNVNERMDVPIIAPPSPLPSLSTEAPVRVRIRRFVEREKALRREDGLVERKSKWGWECIGELREDVLTWFMEVLPSVDIGEGRRAASDTCTCVNSPASTCSISSSHTYASTSPTSSSSHASSSTTITATTTTTPDSRSHSHSDSDSDSHPDSQSRSHSPQTQTQTEPSTPHHTNLADQLLTSPETRFHAAYLFLRFFQLVGRAGARGEMEGERDSDDPSQVWAFGSELDDEGRRLVTWDVGLACLSISIKVCSPPPTPFPSLWLTQKRTVPPRLFGSPLTRIRTRVYGNGATAHRDVLGALQFRLGDTPQGLLGEMWEGVCALRGVVRGAWAGDKGEKEERGEGWNLVQRETWRVLCAAVLVLSHSLSLTPLPRSDMIRLKNAHRPHTHISLTPLPPPQTKNRPGRPQPPPIPPHRIRTPARPPHRARASVRRHRTVVHVRAVRCFEFEEMEEGEGSEGREGGAGCEERVGGAVGYG
ncbi:hypothetical protein C0995_005381 [Termitomyces sp. Mi166|nr:hypothetical protein C0995_005381 [Termitomyces sp. Mi166\